MNVTYEIDRDFEYITADFAEHTAIWVVDQPGYYSEDEYTFQGLLDYANSLPLQAFPFDIIAADFAAAIHQREENSMNIPTIYSKPGCAHCVQLKEKLMDMGIGYKEIDVSQDREAFERVTEDWGYRQVPVLEFDGDTWVNPSHDALGEILGVDNDR